MEGQYGRGGSCCCCCCCFCYYFCSFICQRGKTFAIYFPDSTGGERVKKVYICQLARELSKHGQPFSDRRCLHDAIPPPLQVKAVTRPHEQRRKARPRRAKRLLKLGQVTDRSDFHLTSRSLCTDQIDSKCLYKCFNESYLHALD